MKLIDKSALKSILHSKRANIYYLQYCRVLQKDGRVLFLTESDSKNLFWNIPIANTTCILLGTGTSITQAAVRMLASAGVIIGFCGGGGTPLLSSTEAVWMAPQSEYRPTKYMQKWVSMWLNEDKRLVGARKIQEMRASFIRTVWGKDRFLQEEGVTIDLINPLLECFEKNISDAASINQLLSFEAVFTKGLYKRISEIVSGKSFKRNHKGGDVENEFLNHGNYLAYGLGATALWTLGISHSFPVLHGKTRRGALVFDVADLVKDAIILPNSFICAGKNYSEGLFRSHIINSFSKHSALDYIFDSIKEISEL